MSPEFFTDNFLEAAKLIQFFNAAIIGLRRLGAPVLKRPYLDEKKKVQETKIAILNDECSSGLVWLNLAFSGHKTKGAICGAFGTFAKPCGKGVLTQEWGMGSEKC